MKNSTTNKKEKNKILLGRLTAVLILLVIWEIVVLCLRDSIFFVSPVEVIKRLFYLCTEGGFWLTVWNSFWHIEVGFLVGLIAGILLACLSHFIKAVEYLLWPVMTLVKTVPVVSFIIFALMLLRASALPVLISALMVMPVFYFNTLEGMRNADGKMIQMAKVFKLSFGKKLRHIYMASVKPFFMSAVTLSAGVAWKAGIAAEVIGVPEGTIGEKLYQSKIYLETGDLLAWTIVIVVVSILFEKLFKKLVNKAV